MKGQGLLEASTLLVGRLSRPQADCVREIAPPDRCCLAIEVRDEHSQPILKATMAAWAAEMRKPVPRAFGIRGTSNNPTKAVAAGHSARWSAAIKEYLTSTDRTAIVGFLIKASVMLWVVAIILIVFFG